MRTVAILVNIGLLVLVGRIVTGGNFDLNFEELPLFALMILAPIISTFALLLRGAATKDWLAAYFQRKALEERQPWQGEYALIITNALILAVFSFLGITLVRAIRGN